jgi:hypothetical protein
MTSRSCCSVGSTVTVINTRVCSSVQSFVGPYCVLCSNASQLLKSGTVHGFLIAANPLCSLQTDRLILLSDVDSAEEKHTEK